MDQQLQQTLNFQYYAWGITGNIIAALGVFGNLLSIVVLANPRMTSTTSYYLIMLSIFDSIVLISLVLFMALPIIYFATGQLEGYYRIYPYLHPYAYPAALIAQTCSIYLTVGFTVERFIAVCHPLRATEMCNKSRAKKSIFAIFLSSIIYNIPRMLEYRVVETRNVITNRTEAMYVHTALGADPMFRHVYFIYMHMCVMLVIPFLLLAVLNLQLCRAVKRSHSIAGKVTNSQRRENNLTMMVISVVAVFLVCQVPSIIDNIFMATLPSSVLYTPPFVKLTCVSSLMVITNSAVNFVLYCVFGQKFRGVFVHIFCRRAPQNFYYNQSLFRSKSQGGNHPCNSQRYSSFRQNSASKLLQQNHNQLSWHGVRKTNSHKNGATGTVNNYGIVDRETQL